MTSRLEQPWATILDRQDVERVLIARIESTDQGDPAGDHCLILAETAPTDDGWCWIAAVGQAWADRTPQMLYRGQARKLADVVKFLKGVDPETFEAAKVGELDEVRRALADGWRLN